MVSLLLATTLLQPIDADVIAATQAVQIFANPLAVLAGEDPSDVVPRGIQSGQWFFILPGIGNNRMLVGWHSSANDRHHLLLMGHYGLTVESYAKERPQRREWIQLGAK